MANLIEGTGSQFFPDQQVHATDLNNVSYTSIQTWRSFLKGITKTPGVYLGSPTDTQGLLQGALAVSCNAGGTRLSIAPGLGVDTQGRFINVPYDTAISGSIGLEPLYYPKRPSVVDINPDITGSGVYYVNIYYSPIHSMQEPDDSGNTHYTRVYDSYRIAVETTATTQGLLLATVNYNASGSLNLTDNTDGYVAPDGKRYALVDSRVAHTTYDGGTQDNADSIASLEIMLNEELEKTVGFVHPADGHSITSRIHRDVTILRMELYIELRGGETGTVDFAFYSGSTVAALKGPIGILSTSTPDVVHTSNELNLLYQKNHPIVFKLIRADDAVTRTTATLVYKRR